jgi:hypothetical protein
MDTSRQAQTMGIEKSSVDHHIKPWKMKGMQGEGKTCNWGRAETQMDEREENILSESDMRSSTEFNFPQESCTCSPLHLWAFSFCA